jgi:hypothetical protein
MELAEQDRRFAFVQTLLSAFLQSFLAALGDAELNPRIGDLHDFLPNLSGFDSSEFVVHQQTLLVSQRAVGEEEIDDGIAILGRQVEARQGTTELDGEGYAVRVRQVQSRGQGKGCGIGQREVTLAIEPAEVDDVEVELEDSTVGEVEAKRDLKAGIPGVAEDGDRVDGEAKAAPLEGEVLEEAEGEVRSTLGLVLEMDEEGGGAGGERQDGGNPGEPGVRSKRRARTAETRRAQRECKERTGLQDGRNPRIPGMRTKGRENHRGAEEIQRTDRVTGLGKQSRRSCHPAEKGKASASGRTSGASCRKRGRATPASFPATLHAGPGWRP